jgi:uncharacterized protein YyaL (SSP411 family)
MIAALAKAGAALGEPAYIEAASKAAGFIWTTLRDDEGKLFKRYRDGEAGLSAHLDDYAFLVWGLLELYQAKFQTDHLVNALSLTEIMIEEFWDEQVGGFFFTAKGQSDLIHRGKEIYDGAIPSGNSVAYTNLIRLSRLLLKPEYEERAQAIGEAFSGQVNQLSVGHTQLMAGLLFAESTAGEVVIAGSLESADTQEMLGRLRELYIPHQVVLLRPEDPDQDLIDLLPVMKDQIPIKGQATAYVCQNFACNAPTTDIEEMVRMLDDG